MLRQEHEKWNLPALLGNSERLNDNKTIKDNNHWQRWGEVTLPITFLFLGATKTNFLNLNLIEFQIQVARVLRCNLLYGVERRQQDGRRHRRRHVRAGSIAAGLQPHLDRDNLTGLAAAGDDEPGLHSQHVKVSNYIRALQMSQTTRLLLFFTLSTTPVNCHFD